MKFPSNLNYEGIFVREMGPSRVTSDVKSLSPKPILIFYTDIIYYQVTCTGMTFLCQIILIKMS